MNLSKQMECISVLNEKKWTVAFAESASGGKIYYNFASLPAAEKIVLGCIVAFHDHMKEYFFGIKPDVLKQFGRESAEVARRMASTLGQYLRANICISVTGACDREVSCKGKNTPQSIYIHIIFPDSEVSKKFQFTGNKGDVAEQTVAVIAEMIINQICPTRTSDLYNMELPMQSLKGFFD
jgi:nicotinamide-nucleotide amidase